VSYTTIYHKPGAMSQLPFKSEVGPRAAYQFSLTLRQNLLFSPIRTSCITFLPITACATHSCVPNVISCISDICFSPSSVAQHFRLIYLVCLQYCALLRLALDCTSQLLVAYWSVIQSLCDLVMSRHARPRTLLEENPVINQLSFQYTDVTKCSNKLFCKSLTS